MQCVKPVYLKEKNIYVPCQHCVACRIAYAREWSVRLIDELSYWSESGFVTLTYDDEHLPADKGVHKRDLQLFMKRLRKTSKRTLKFFACGEYGEHPPADWWSDTVGRPHYHLILFGLGRASCQYDRTSRRWLSEDISAAWKFGHHQVDTVTANSCRYVASYVLKKYNGKKKEEVYGALEAPFRLSSNGLGKQFLLDNHEQIISQGMTWRGIRVGLPRYYQKKLHSIYQKIAIEAYERSEDSERAFSEYWNVLQDFDTSRAFQALENNHKEVEKFEQSSFSTIDDYYKNSRKAKEKNILANQEVKKAKAL